MANVKISQLPNINGNLTANSLLPVVSTNGTFITDKVNVSNLANYILGESGNTFASGNISNLAYNVINASQPNITTVGTLTGLTVVGTTNVGYPNNFVLLGGTAGQVLSTFGDGSLGWVDQIGASGPIGPDGATGATGLTGATGPEGPPGPASTIGATGPEGATGPAGAAGADGATGATGVAGADGSTGATGASGPGFVWTGPWNPSGYYIGGQDVVSYAGSSYIKIGDGNSGSAPPDDPIRWSVMAEEGAVGAVGATGPAGSSANTGNVTFDNINIIGTGNLHLQPDPANTGSYLDIFLTSGPDLHLVASAAANLILGQDAGPNVMTSWDGNVYVQSWNTGSNTQGGIWNFGEDGLLTLPGGYVKIGAQYGSDAILSSNVSFGVATQGNATTFINWSDDVANTSMLAAIYVNDPTGNAGNISVRTGNVGNANVWKFVTDGSVIFPTLTVDLHNGGNQTAQTLQFGDDTQQAIITGPTPAVDTNAQRLIIQGQRGNGTGEGGDVYFWAGDADTNGGDIKIYAGDADTSGYGGYINIDAGSGVDGGGQITITGGFSSNGQGGQVTVVPGASANANGAPLNLFGGQASGDGGNVVITAGYGQANGGQVNITGGISGLGLANYGNVVINAGASTWTFDNTGNIVLAGGNSVIQSIANSSLDPTLPNVSTMTLTPDANYNSQVLVLDPTAPGHIHLRAYAFSNIDEPAANIFLGGEQTAFEVTSGPNNVAKIHSGNLTWTFSNNSGASVIDLPGESYIRSNQDTLNIQSVDANGIGRGIYIGSNGTLYFWDGNSQSVSLQQDNTNANLTAIGNASITSNVSTWTFVDDGTLLLPRDAAGNTDPYLWITGGNAPSISSVDVSLGGPANFQIVSDYLNLSGYSGAKVAIKADNGEIATDGNMVLTINNANVGNTYSWTFGTDGNLTLPGNTFAVNYANGTQVPLSGGTPAGSNNEIQFNSNGAFGASANYTFTDTVGGGSVEVGNELLLLGNGTISTSSNNLNIQPAGNLIVTSSIYNWTFDLAGNLTLPGNTFAVNYANGSQASAPLVDVLNTNGLSTVFYPTFVENRTDGQIVRADVDLSYRSDTNTLTVGNITGNTNGYTLGYLNIPQISASNTTLALTDAGKHYYSTTAGNLTLTIPLNSSVAFPTGTAVSIVVQAAGNVLVNAAAGVTLYMAGSSSAGNRVVGTYGMATLMKVASDTWFINGTGVY
jgi:hypothetical protein